MRNAGQSYALSLNDLLQVLRASSGQSYQVRAEVPASLLPSFLKRGVFQAEVMVRGGQVATCLIRDQATTVRMEGAEAFEAVRSQEQLIWQVVPSTLPEPSAPAQIVPFPVSTPPWAASSALVPWVGRPAPVKFQLTREMVAQLEDRRLRKVWLLIDGQRCVADLAVLLQLSQEAVSEALTLLETRGLITSGPPHTERR